jgi:hypothetical protein
LTARTVRATKERADRTRARVALDSAAGADGSLAGRRPKAAAAALAELVHRRGLERASEVLARWNG